MDMNSTQTTATYTKLRDGSWGIRIAGVVAPTVGATVTVAKRSGETKREIVGRVVWQGADAVLCTIASSTPAPRTYGQRIAAQRTTYGQRRGWGSGHGSAAPVAGYSRYCTDNETCGCYDCAS